MIFKYLSKEAQYYRKLGEGHLKRMFFKFLFAKTPASKIVNTSLYNKIYSGIINKKVKKTKPTTLQIENTNICNAKCIMCPHTIMKRKAKIMSLEEFKKICENILKYEKIKLITLSGFGEPLIDEKIDEKIKWLNETHLEIEIDIYTNASLLSREISEKLLELKIHKINFSINGTKKTYKKIMGLDYKKTEKNILYFLKRKKELGMIYPLINISLMIMKENYEQTSEIINFWKDKADSIMSYLPSDWAGKMKGINFAIKNPFKYKRWPCSVLWRSVTVDVEGNVIMCCRDYESKVKFGNLIEENIRNIRNSKKFQDLMKKHLDYNFSSSICKSCDNSFDSSLDWIA